MLNNSLQVRCSLLRVALLDTLSLAACAHLAAINVYFPEVQRD